MGVIKSASGSSVWRGLDYYKHNKVISYKRINDNECIGKIRGSNNKDYDVIMNTEHPRSSKCNCPHAKDRKIVCKHIVALYFTVFPKEAKKFEEDARKAEEEYEKYQEQLYDNVKRRIYFMTKGQLQEALLDVLNLSPEWVYERFVRDYIER